MAAEIIRKELLSSIQVDDIIAEQDCIENMSSICNIRQQNIGQDVFFKAKKVLNTSLYTCDTQWEISETTIGEDSSNATIYQGQCDGNKKEYVLKYINLKGLSEKQLKDIANEINTQQLVYKLSGFTTAIYQIFINDDYVMFVTDKLKNTVYRYFINKIKNDTSHETIEMLKKILKRCYDITVELMKTHNIFHLDEHLNNFMLTDDFDETNFDPSTIKIIDFGKTIIYTDLNEQTKYNKIQKRLIEISSFIDFNLNHFRYNKPVNLKSISDIIPDINEYI